MASPAFVYAFDNLGPEKFVELCGLILGARYKGFLLSSTGPDGGIDGESDPVIGELRIEERTSLNNTIYSHDDLIVFQFKHKVVARVGQSQARQQLLSLYKSNTKKKNEVLKENIIKLSPKTYILVTNVEVNTNFRHKFIEQCKDENKKIDKYQIIGLDDLENWVTMDRHLRSMYFPTLFDIPRFNLKLRLGIYDIYEPKSNLEQLKYGGDITCATKKDESGLICIMVMNIGSVPSYIDGISFRILVNGEIKEYMPMPLPKGYDPYHNPDFNDPIEPGRCKRFNYSLNIFSKEIPKVEKVTDYFFSEVRVSDQVENIYSIDVSEEIRRQIFLKTVQ